MKKLLVSIMLMSSFAHAEVLQVSVKNFNFSYKDPHGEGTASSFTRNKSLSEAVSVQVDRLDKDFRFVATGSENVEFDFKDAPSFMTEAETMSISGFNMNLSSLLTLSMTSGRFISRSGSLKLDGLSVDCARDIAKEELMDQVLTGCIQKLSFKTSKFQSQSEDGLLGILNASLAEVVADKSALTINSLNITSSSGKYDLSADVKAQISGKVKSSGNVSYEARTGLLTLKISEVKFGILNLTGKVFDELKKKESDKLKVKQPYVYYSLK